MTAEELNKIGIIEQESRAQYTHSLNVCVAAGCLSSRSDQVKEALAPRERRLEELELENKKLREAAQSRSQQVK